MLLSTVILKFRKQVAILTIASRQEIECIFGHIRLGGSGLAHAVSGSGSWASLRFSSQGK